MTDRRNGRPSARTTALGGRAGGLEAPHRRLQGGFRPLEKASVLAYRTAAWFLAHLPPRPAWTVIGWFSKIGYLAWPTKRGWVDANFGHVLRRDPGHRSVRRMALRAYGHYARYLVELMRLPAMPPASIGELVDPDGLDELERLWRESDGLIAIVGHIGNNEACAAGVASRGWPVSVVADDSSFPEMFELLRHQRESWGVTIIPWRNLRAVYAVLRRKEILALLVDWGYRVDGIPVRLFGSWTTLPAGPATLAAKSGATIVPLAVRRLENGRFRLDFAPSFKVPSTAPGDLQIATQAMADALEKTIAAAPDQWYSFKPMWPDTPEEAAELEARATAMLADTGPATKGEAVDGAPVDGAPVEAAADEPAARPTRRPRAARQDRAATG